MQRCPRHEWHVVEPARRCTRCGRLQVRSTGPKGNWRELTKAERQALAFVVLVGFVSTAMNVATGGRTSR